MVEKLTNASPPVAVVTIPSLPGFEAPTTQVTTSSPLEASAVELVLDARGDAELNGRSIESAESLLGDLRSLRARWSLLHPNTPPPRVLHLWAHARLPMHRVIPWIEPARALNFDVRLLARAPVSAAARDLRGTCPASLGLLCSSIDPARPTANAALANEALRTSMGSCRSLVREMAGLEAMNMQDRARHLREVSPGALRECGCARGVDLEAFEFLALFLSGVGLPRVASFDWQDGSAVEHETVAAWIAQRTAAH